MNLPRRTRRLGLVAFLLVVVAVGLWRWERSPVGEIHEERGLSAPAHDPMAAGIFLSEEAKRNIELRLALVEIRDVERVRKVPGMIRIDPDGIALITTRIQGKVTRVHVNVGANVRPGQDLADIQSLVPGNPPPTIHLNSPISGIVVERNIVLGEAVVPEKVLFKVIDPAAVFAEAWVPETDIGSVRLRQRARIAPLANERISFSAKVIFVGSAADEETRTYPVWVRPDRSDTGLLSGRFVDVFLVVDERREVLAIPRSAILSTGPERYVFVQKEGLFFRQPVVVGLESDLYAEMLEGLLAGDRIVVTGNYELAQIPEGREAPSAAVEEESRPHTH